jgi:hypothetical protein
MPDDPTKVLDALDRAEDAFGGYASGAPAHEEDLDPATNEPPVLQLRKACRLSMRVGRSASTMGFIRA